MANMTEMRFKAMKKLLDLTEWKDFVKDAMKDSEFEDDEFIEVDSKAKDEMNEYLQNTITAAISAAIPRTLYLKLKQLAEVPFEVEDNNVEVNVGPFTYSVKIWKNGEVSTLTPAFDSSDPTGQAWMVSMFNQKPHKNEDMANIIADSIEDDLLIDTVMNYFEGREYDTVKEDWVNNKPTFKGIEFSESDIRMWLSIHVLTIIYSLLDSKDNEIEIPGEGIYKLTYPDHELLYVGFIPDKEFKLIIKNDELSEEVAG